MTASVPTRPASARSAVTAPGCALASAGWATIGESVPSKSRPIRACSGPASSAASPARPAAVCGRNPAGPSARLTGVRRAYRAPSRPPGPPGSQPFDQDGVERRRLGPVDQLVEQLVVTRGRDGETLPDFQLLRPRAGPGAALESKDAHVALL